MDILIILCSSLNAAFKCKKFRCENTGAFFSYYEKIVESESPIGAGTSYMRFCYQASCLGCIINYLQTFSYRIHITNMNRINLPIKGGRM